MHHDFLPQGSCSPFSSSPIDAGAYLPMSPGKFIKQDSGPNQPKFLGTNQGTASCTQKIKQKNLFKLFWIFNNG